MKKIILVLGIVFLVLGCVNDESTLSYTSRSTREFNEYKSPVILFSKSLSFGVYGVTVVDGDGNFHTIGNMSTLANGIGDCYKIGDTLK